MYHISVFLAVLLLVISHDSANGDKDENPIHRPYVPVGSLPLSAKQLNICRCRGPFTTIARVCSNNNVTYLNPCQLVDVMRKLPGIGQRCNKACPCPDFAQTAKTYNLCSPTAKLAKKPHFMKYWRWNPVQKFCLTDGSEHTRGSILCALAANKSLGIQCPGACSECPTYNCPTRLLQNIPLRNDNPW